MTLLTYAHFHLSPGFNGHFTWKAYLQLEKAIAAPEACFDLEPVEHEFKVGTKLEAVDQENNVNICVATVTQVLGRDVWITFDGESRSEQLFDVRSHDLFPVGWCEMSGHELQWPRPSSKFFDSRVKGPAFNQQLLEFFENAIDTKFGGTTKRYIHQFLQYFVRK